MTIRLSVKLILQRQATVVLLVFVLNRSPRNLEFRICLQERS